MKSTRLDRLRAQMAADHRTFITKAVIGAICCMLLGAGLAYGSLYLLHW